MPFAAPNQPSWYFNKRDRAPSASDSPQNAVKRPRAHDVEAGAPVMSELFKGPDNWTNLRKMVTSGMWSTRTQKARAVQQDSQMHLEDVSTHLHEAERGFEEPRFPFAASNPYYTRDLEHQVRLVYEQWPCYVTAINAEGIPFPPALSQSSGSEPLPAVYCDPSSGTPRRNPSRCSVQAPWAPLRPASPTPIVKAESGQVRASNSGGYLFSPPEVRRLTGVGSVIQRLHDEMVPFVRSMTRAHMFNLYSPVESLAPDFFLRILVSQTSPSLASRFLCGAYDTPEELLSHVATRNSRLAIAHAMYDFALLEALDACAVLGGVELPIWPPNPSYSGCWIPPAPPPSAEVDESYFLQARARKLERWGVPLWCEVPRRLNRRYEAGPTGGPVAVYPTLELRHQEKLASLTARNPPVPVKKVCVAVGGRSASRPFHPSSSSLPQDPEVRRRVQHAISALVDPDSPEIKTFEAFNSDMKQLLGVEVWSGEKYEAQHHHGHIRPESKQTSRWLKMRDGVHDCGHKGALLAAVEIPYTWYQPQSYPLDFRGLNVGLGTPCRPVEPPQPAVPMMDWYVVEVAGLGKGDETQGKDIFDACHPRGALGYRWVLCKIQNKDERGHTIRHSRYQVELLFKSVQAQGEAALRIKESFPDLVVTESSCLGKDMAWINLFNLPMDWVYVAALFNRPLLASRRQELLALSPPSSVPPTRSDGVPAGVRADAERSHLGKLCHFVLFEYDAKYPPAVQPAPASSLNPTPSSSFPAPSSSFPAPSSSFPAPSRSFPASASTSVPASALDPLASATRHALNLCHLTLERFTDLAFALPTADSPLSDEEVLRFQRLALVLQACKRRAPFSSRIFPSNGSPYREILLYVASVVKKSAGLNGYVFHPGQQRKNIGPWAETLKMKPDGSIEVFIDTDISPKSSPLPSQNEVDEYYEACSRENRKTRSEKRRNRQQGGGNMLQSPPSV